MVLYRADMNDMEVCVCVCVCDECVVKMEISDQGGRH